MPPTTRFAHNNLSSGSNASAQGQYLFIKRRVRALTGIDLDSYKSPQMQRRLNALLVRSGCSSWQEYFRRLESDPVALRAFNSYLTINVSKFFRDAPKWTYLADKVIPGLLERRRRLRIWSAGCSHGAEAYTIAMILDGLQNGRVGHYVLATDIDSDMLSKAKLGGPYSKKDIEDVDEARLLRCFEKRDGSCWVSPSLRAKVQFRQHDLLRDPFENDFDLIVCRNVVIYFTDESKKSLYRRFAASLRTGGGPICGRHRSGATHS